MDRRDTPTPGRRAGGVACALLLVAAVAPARAAEPGDVSVEAAREGSLYTVRASADLVAGRALVWSVLTDYERMTGFVPDLHASRVVARDGNRVTVEQKGEARLWVFSVPIEVRFIAEEQPYALVTSRAVAGSFREMTGRYELQPKDAGVRLIYTGRLAPDFGMPPLIDTALVRGQIRRQFTALVEEIRRRAAAEPGDR